MEVLEFTLVEEKSIQELLSTTSYWEKQKKKTKQKSKLSHFLFSSLNSLQIVH
jgi:hypothetical protein